MKRILGFVALTLLLLSCDSEPLVEKPKVEVMLGVWECSKFPVGFKKAIGAGEEELTSRIEIDRNGFIKATNFPLSDPYRLEDMTTGWDFRSGTTAGFEFYEGFLQCRKFYGKLLLRYSISGEEKYRVEYERVN